MNPEIHAHFHVELSNVCNFCCPRRAPSQYYVSKRGVVRPWNASKGSPTDAMESYKRILEIAHLRIQELGLDAEKGIAFLGSEIDLHSKAEEKVPVSLTDLRTVALAIERFKSLAREKNDI